MNSGMKRKGEEIMNEQKITLYLEDIKYDAIHCMKNCMAYISLGNHRMAHINYGMASIYDSLLAEEGIVLEEISEHYKTMLDIYYETYLRKD